MSNILNTPQEILSILSGHPEESFYINELIRLTGKFPNSVQKAVQNLYVKGLVTKVKRGNKIFYQISPSAISVASSAFSSEKTITWVKLLNRPSSYAFNYAVCKSNRDNLPKIYGVAVPSFWFNGTTYAVYYIKSELELLGKTINQKLETEPDFAIKDIKSCKTACENLITYSKKLCGKNYLDLNNKQISSYLEDYIKLYEAVFPYITTPHAIERYFESKIREQITNSKYLQVVLSPNALFDEERESALIIADHVKNNGKDESYKEKLQDHYQKYCWLPMWMLSIKPLPIEYFRQEIDDILLKIDNPQVERENIRQNDLELSKNVNKILKSINASEMLKKQVSLLQDYISLRTYRKNAICQSHHYVLDLINEISKRLLLSFDEVCLLSFDELFEGLKDKLSKAKLKQISNERSSGFGLLMWKNSITTVTQAKGIVKTMEQYRIIQPMQKMTDVIRGNSASLGRAIGKVKIVHNTRELDKVKSGDILVSKMTTPDFVIAMGRCVGIITDEGGVTCHAAIVSREMGIPCIVGTNVATKQLNDNDLVELNANEGFVRILETEHADLSTNQIVGTTLFKGKITGKVKVVYDLSDFTKVEHGDILVTTQTTPEYLSCLYRVGGLIVDEYSLTSHASLYANALKIPAIMGTKYARTVLNDNQIITLDADSGIISI